MLEILAQSRTKHSCLRLDAGRDRAYRPSDGDHFIERSILVPPSLLSPLIYWRYTQKVSWKWKDSKKCEGICGRRY